MIEGDSYLANQGNPKLGGLILELLTQEEEVEYVKSREGMPPM